MLWVQAPMGDPPLRLAALLAKERATAWAAPFLEGE
jgi:hypothetical protein